MGKLRNKKTGEVVEVNALGLVFNRHNQPFDLGKYASIKELTEAWEDYESERDKMTKWKFFEYLQFHRDERFLQAVRNFTKEYIDDDANFLFVSKHSLEDYIRHYDKFYDTFYWECDSMMDKNNDSEGK